MNDRSHLALAPQPSLDSARTIWARATLPAPALVASPGARLSEPRARAVLLQATAETCSALEDAVVAAAVAAQRARSLTVALEEVLVVLAVAESDPIHRPTPTIEQELPTSPLSPREREVLALVAEGRSNKAIAKALYVSPNTIKTHVASLLNKFAATSRVQLATIATRRLAS